MFDGGCVLSKPRPPSGMECHTMQSARRPERGQSGQQAVTTQMLIVMLTVR